MYKVINFIILSDVLYSCHIYPNSRFREEVDREISEMKLSLSAGYHCMVLLHCSGLSLPNAEEANLMESLPKTWTPYHIHHIVYIQVHRCRCSILEA